MKPLFLKALEDLAKLVFEELDPGIWHHLWFEDRSHFGKFIVFLMLVYDIHVILLFLISYLQALTNQNMRLFVTII
jgi:hypothetical protein